MGPRRSALRARRRRARRQRSVAGIALTVGVVLVAAALSWFTIDQVRNQRESPQPAPTTEAQIDPVVTTLLFGTKEKDEAAGAVWLALVGVNTETGRGAVVYVPAHTGVEVPGRGLGGVGEAFATGGAPLLLVSAESLLGVPIDRYVELSDRDARVLFRAVGELSVDVPQEVRIAAGRDQARLLFAEGSQTLSPPFLVKLLFIEGLDANELDLGNRHVAFFDALFDAFRGDPKALAEAIERSAAALGESDAAAEDHAATFQALAATAEADLTISVLPVQALGVGGSQLYATDTSELTAFLEEALGTRPGLTDEVRVQILNGNGVPGIGQEVAERLQGGDFRVFLSGNAARLNHRTTKIVVYEATGGANALAKQVRERLGVGKVLVSVQRQGIVDLTIIVGRDFLGTRD